MVYEKIQVKGSGLRQQTHEGVDIIMDKAESLSEQGKNKIAQMNDSAARIKENVDHYIKSNPGTSLMIAAGVGAVIGGMLAAAFIGRNK